MQIIDAVSRILNLKMKGDKWVMEAIPPLVEVNKEMKEIETKKKEECEPMRTAIKEVDSKYKSVFDVLLQMDTKLRERVMREHEGSENVGIDGIGELVFAAGPWEIEVTNLKMVEPQYLTIDRAKVTTDAKNGKAVFKGMNVTKGRSLRVLTKT